MHRVPSRAAALLGAVALSLAIVAPATANHSWNGYHWARTSNPFTVRLADNVSSVWDPILQTTSSDWSQSSVLDTRIVSGTVTNPKNCKAGAGFVNVCNTTYGNNGWLGVAGITVSGGHITGAYVKLNDSYFNTAQYNTTAWRNLVSCQEVGHAFGLGHQDEGFSNANLGTCMDYTNDPGSNQHPNQHDFDQLVAIYSHVDTKTTLTNGGSAATLAGRPVEAAWGQLVANTVRGSWFVRDLGAGNFVVTHVFWAY